VLRNSTKREYIRHMTALEADYGEVTVAGVNRENVLNLRDNMFDYPRKADARVGMLRTLFNFGLDRPREFGLTANPASRIKKLHKVGVGWPTWPPHIIDAVFQMARDQDEMEVLFALTFALFTGQRCADLAAMQWTAVQDGFIQVFQEKSALTDSKTGDPIPRTGKELSIPIHKELSKMIIEVRQMRPTTHNVLSSKSGIQWTAARLSQTVSDFMRKNGLAGYSLHGLRKAAVVKLKEIGQSKEMIKLITGQETDEMVDHYGRAADPKKIAQAVMKRREQDEE
jgi:integrase